MFSKAKTDPKSLSFDALVGIKQSIDLEIAARKDKEIDAIKTKAIATASALGVSLAELMGISVSAPVLIPVEARKAKRAPKIKYRDPDNGDNTWTGKGRPPRWLQDKLDEGADKEAFRAQ